MTLINPINQEHAQYFLITIDVEDWFQVENFKPWIAFETWNQRELRLERNVHRLLDLFDSIKLPSEATNPTDATNGNNPRTLSATFFVLCWIAEHLPHLVREIFARGHEVASHGCYHKLPSKMTLHALNTELTDSRKLLEDTLGNPVFGFRAPSFAIDDDILEAIAKTGYLYDSSYNSFSLHGRYGKISLNGQDKFGIAHRVNDKFYELPISNLDFLGSVLPLGGGAYFRLCPFRFFKLGVQRILRKNDAYLFYIHPWEIDPEQPRVKKASWNHKLRHYTKLSKTYSNLDRIINTFKHCNFTTCNQYLDAQGARIPSSE